MDTTLLSGFLDALSKVLVLLASGLLVWGILTGRLARTRQVLDSERDRIISSKASNLARVIDEAEHYLNKQVPG
jgi:Na+/H+ antiporter NhaB